jgi:hypothetical protein
MGLVAYCRGGKTEELTPRPLLEYRSSNDDPEAGQAKNNRSGG